MDEEMFIKKLNQANDIYFKKHFLNQDINTAISEAMTEGLKVLLKAYAKFVFLENSICRIKNNKKFWKTLDIETKVTVKLALNGVKKINKVIQNILVPISEGMEMDKEK